MQTSFAAGHLFFSLFHSLIVAVAPWRVESTQDWLSETITTRSTSARSALRRASGAETLVPPPPIEAKVAAFTATRANGSSFIGTTRSSNGRSNASRFRRSTAAATRAATSMHLTLDEAPLR
jgi:hypothetical protein